VKQEKRIITIRETRKSEPSQDPLNQKVVDTPKTAVLYREAGCEDKRNAMTFSSGAIM
jgi:hypothetical protein